MWKISTTCHNLNHPNIKIKCLKLFQNNNKIILLLRIGTCDNTKLVHVVHQKRHILVTNDNTYMINQK